MADDFESFLKDQAAPKPPASAPADPFEQFMAQAKGAQDSAAQGTVISNMGIDGAAAGKAARIGQQLGMPQQAVETDLPHYSAQAQAKQNSDLLTENPVLSDWVAANPDAARIANDDMHNLKSVSDTLLASPLAFAKGLAGSTNKLAAGVNLLLGAFPALYDKAANAVTGTNESNAADAWFASMVQPRLDQQRSYDLEKTARLPEKIAQTGGNLLGMLSQIILSGTGGAAADVAGQTTGQFVAGALEHGAKAMAVPALNDAVDTGRQVYDLTGDSGKAIKAAQAQLAATMAMGVVPLSAPGGLATRLATGAISGTVSGEATRVGMNAVLPEQMRQQFDIENVILGALAGAGLGGVMGPHAVDDARAGAAQQHADMLRSVMGAAEDSALRDRAPDQFKNFVDHANQSGVKDVFIDANLLSEALAQSKNGARGASRMAEDIPTIAQQLPEALALKGDIKIPLSDLATYLPGSGLEESILPHLRTSIGAMSEAEAQVHIDEAPERAKAMAEQVDQNYQQDEPLRTVYNDVYSQLIKIGRDPVTAAREAMLWRERAATRAQRLGGVDPLDLYNENPLTVRRDIPGVLADKKNIDVHIDPLLDELRSTKEPTEETRSDRTLQDLHGYLASIGADPLKMTNPQIRKLITADIKAREGERLTQGERGLYVPSKNMIVMLKDANFSTFLHESGHSWLEDLRTDALRADAPQQVKDDFDIIKQWAGIKEDGTIQRDAHEQFARGIEAYLREGVAPSKALTDVFARFKDWLVRIYKNMSDLHVMLTDEVQGVMDRLLATDESIAQAREAQRLDVPLLDKDSMTPAEYQAYAEQYHAAKQEANDEVRNRLMRDLTRERTKWWRDESAAMRETVEKEVDALPQYRAIKWLRDGVFPDGKDMLGMEHVKLSKTDLVASYSEAFLKSLPHGVYQVEGGIHPDLIAERLGYKTGADLIRALAETRPREQVVRAETQTRMLNKHGDMLNDGTLADKAMMAVHNDHQAEVFSTEMRILRRQGAKGQDTSIKTMKAVAKDVISRKVVSELDPAYYLRASEKAGREAETAMVGKDMAMGLARNLDEAYAAKQRQMLNSYLYKEAQAKKDGVESGIKYQKRFDRTSVRNRLPGDFLEQIDALREQYDFRRVPRDPNAKQKEALITWAEAQRASNFEPAISDWLAAFHDPIHYGDLTVDQFDSVINAIKSIEHIAREMKTVTTEGKRQSLDAVVHELQAPMRERGEAFTKQQLLEPPIAGTDSALKVMLHKAATMLRMSVTDLKPQDFKRNLYDMQNAFGPFGKYIYDRVMDRNYWKNDQLKAISDEFQAVGKELGKDWQKSLYDLVPNERLNDLDLAPKDGFLPMKLTRGRMLGIARHVGNESNFDKLTKGMGWKPADVWSFLHDNMTAKDWRATQAQWDVFEKYWPQIEDLARRMGGVPPDKIPLREFDTKFGKMKGGYAPIDYDPIRSKLGAKFGEIMLEPTERLTDQKVYKSTTTFNGSMTNRKQGYTDRINLDYHSAEGRLRDTIHDLAYREALTDVNKIITHPEFKSTFMQTFGREEYAGLQKWLQGIKGMHAGEDDIRGFEKFLQYARTGVVMTGIAYRLSTVLVHGGSAQLKSMGYLGDGPGAKYFGARVARMATGNAREDIAAAQAKFPEIRTRMLQMDRDYKQGSASMYEAESWRQKNDRFGHMMVAWSDALSAVPTAWAAYDRAVTEGIPVNQGGTGKPMTDAEASHYANKVVREAHGTALETNRSLFMQSRGVKGLFGTIYGFMNNTFGQIGDMYDKAFSGGRYQDHSALTARALGTLIVPALWAAYLKHGTPDDNKEPWYTWAAKAITGEIAGTVPFVRDAWSMIEYKNGSSEVAPIRILSDTVKTGQDVIGELQGKQTKIIQDAANAIGELLHIGGLGQAGKTVQYFRELNHGKQHPNSAAQLAHDAALGNHDKKK